MSMADRTLGYNDVLAAWKYYLEHDNQGRGVQCKSDGYRQV